MKKERLKTSSLEYLAILFIIWQLVDYYSKTYRIDAGNDPARTIAKIMEFDGVSYVRLSFPKIEQEHYFRLVFEMKQVFNDYLRYVLLPEQKILKPFLAGNDYRSLMEPLYVKDIFEDDSYINLDVIYIDNMKAYTCAWSDELQFEPEEL
ncbi:MAG: hypothetical protein IJZ42_04515 [Lachnospiraceae bacterium]|nr:hypothetical protein [Lachnospiraceae bacterium]MBQ8261229.1 hypothetical protein [Lachnospiraceae bacterium]